MKPKPLDLNILYIYKIYTLNSTVRVNYLFFRKYIQYDIILDKHTSINEPSSGIGQTYSHVQIKGHT